MSLPFSIHVLCLNFFNQKRGNGRKALFNPLLGQTVVLLLSTAFFSVLFFFFFFSLFLLDNIKFPARTPLAETLYLLY